MTLVSPGKPARTISRGVSCEVEDQQETLYTCPANCKAEVTMLFVVNANGNTTVSATWFDSSESEAYNILGSKNMTTGEYVLLNQATLVLESGDAIRVTPTGNTTPNIDAMCTVTETFVPVG